MLKQSGKSFTQFRGTKKHEIGDPDPEAAGRPWPMGTTLNPICRRSACGGGAYKKVHRGSTKRAHDHCLVEGHAAVGQVKQNNPHVTNQRGYVWGSQADFICCGDFVKNIRKMSRGFELEERLRKIMRKNKVLFQAKALLSG